MKCRHCESDRIMDIFSHSKDSGSLSYPKLKLEHDGYFPFIDDVCGGDDATFFFCLDCGTMQGDSFPISDDTIRQAFREANGEDDEDEDDDLVIIRQPPPPASFSGWRLNDGSGVEHKTTSAGKFFRLPWMVDVHKTPNFMRWALTIDSEDRTLLIAIIDVPNTDNLIIDIIAVVEDNSLSYDILEWDTVKQHLRKVKNND